MPYAKISSWGIGEPMNVKVKTMKLLENLEEYLHVLGITFFFFLTKQQQQKSSKHKKKKLDN